jgi:hypothetical protein
LKTLAAQRGRRTRPASSPVMDAAVVVVAGDGGGGGW